MQLSAYLDRIHYSGSLDLTYETLAGIHRAHQLSIPYENLDIHLGRYMPLEEAYLFDKMVIRRRGGWCYEMNGLLAWALREVGFNVTLLAGAIARETGDSTATGNHLVLRVDLDRPYLADVGFSFSFHQPIPLEPGVHQQKSRQYQLRREEAQWFFQNLTEGGPTCDFTLESRPFAYFAPKSHERQIDPASDFVRFAFCHLFTANGIVRLKEAVLRRYVGSDMTEQILEDEQTYEQVLFDEFGLKIDRISDLWHKVRTRHLNWTVKAS
jgi:N-hydroxyarylamine O-acetyltransferase